MPKSRRRKPKKNRPPTTAAPKKRLDSFSTAQQVPPLSTEPLQEPPSVTAPRQEQPASQIKQTAKRLADWWQRAWRWMRSSGWPAAMAGIRTYGAQEIYSSAAPSRIWICDRPAAYGSELNQASTSFLAWSLASP